VLHLVLRRKKVMLNALITIELKGKCPEMHVIICMPLPISVTRCPVDSLVNLTITSGNKYERMMVIKVLLTIILEEASTVTLIVPQK